MGAIPDGVRSSGLGNRTTAVVFRRAGTVRAFQLREPRSWTTEAGSTLTIPAGGWWVISPDGTQRGVDAAEFFRSCINATT